MANDGECARKGIKRRPNCGGLCAGNGNLCKNVLFLTLSIAKETIGLQVGDCMANAVSIWQETGPCHKLHR